MIEIVLPFPPTVNHYWKHRHTKTRTITYITEAGKKFRRDAILLIKKQRANKHYDVRMRAIIELYPPDKRKRDLDNYNKGVLDALTHAGVIVDDSIIDELIIKRCKKVDGGETVVKLEPISEIIR